MTSSIRAPQISNKKVLPSEILHLDGIVLKRNWAGEVCDVNKGGSFQDGHD